ncbi:hypothetical protein C8J56DRAFT_539581 [Mycena floridula]|nr:hypothetical protein C8J56DRAFT_539581 [Mycena floridula]
MAFVYSSCSDIPRNPAAVVLERSAFPGILKCVVFLTVGDLAGFMIECTIYVLYSLLVFLCIWLLWKRQKAHYEFHMASVVSLYILITVRMMVGCYLVANKARYTDNGFFGQLDHTLSSTLYRVLIPLGTAQSRELAASTILPLPIVIQILYLISNLIAAAIVVHRCCLIWPASKRITFITYGVTAVVTPLQFSALFSSGTFTEINPNAASAIGLVMLPLATLFINLLLVWITVRSAWLISGSTKTSSLRRQSARRRYETTTSILMESGILYPIALLVAGTTLLTAGPYTTVPSDIFTAIMSQALGIVPTLILIRVSLGVSVDEVDSGVSAFSENARRMTV